MAKSKVFYTDFRTEANGTGLPGKLQKLIRKAGIGDIDMDGIFPVEEKKWEKLPLEEFVWNVSFCTPEDYAPGDECPAAFGEEETLTKLYNVIRKKKRFAGFVRYETEFTVPGEGMDRREYGLDLGQVGEVAYVWVDGQKAGERIIPPYRFRFTAIPG